MDPKHREVLFYARVMFLKYIVQIEIAQTEHKIPTQTHVFPGG
jgi:hypothetical protein